MSTAALDAAEKRAAYHREYYRRNRERLLAKMAEWRASNREHSKGYFREYNAQRDPSKVALAHQTYRERHAERIAGQKRSYRECHPGMDAEYYRKNKEKVAAYNRANRRRRTATQMLRIARQKQATIVAFTMEQLDQRLSMYGHRCWICGGNGEHVDHVIPLSKGGFHTLSNLRPACGRCNIRKGNRSWKTL